MAAGFAVLLPVKAPGRGKSRLQVPDRASLTHAFVLDTIAALRNSTHVSGIYVICDDPAAEFGVQVLPDLGEGDLNRAIARAAESLAVRAVAAMLPDLPALRTSDVDAALAQAMAGRSHVHDHEGTGTTLLAAVNEPLGPAFGPDSAARHLASGSVPIDGPLTSLRLDVDTLTDLDLAIRLGVGENTAAALPVREAPPQQS